MHVRDPEVAPHMGDKVGSLSFWKGTYVKATTGGAHGKPLGLCELKQAKAAHTHEIVKAPQ